MDMQNFLRAFISARQAISSRSKRRRGSPAQKKYESTRALERLEERALLSGNIVATGATVIGSDLQPLSSISAGQLVFIQAKFSTTGLPSNASYDVSVTVNGLTRLTATLTLGAGVSGTDNWIENLGSFYASPGTNQVTVTVDPDHSVAETSFTDNAKNMTFSASSTAVGIVSSTVAQVRNFYGVNSIPNFGTSSADGSGQVIALIDAANEPTILTDLDGFDKAMSATTTSTETLYQQYGAASSFVTVYNQSGQNITQDIVDSGTNGVPAMDPTGHWEGEETLDVEWAHAMAPGAKLVIIEVNDDASVFTNLVNANALAASLPGVTVVSNSWGMNDFSGETTDDSSIFVTPQGHPGVTFLTASNDNGAAYYGGHGPLTPENSYYPATSPNVVSVGGTQITLNNDGYGSEIGWSFPTPTSTFNFGNSVQTGSWQSKAGGFNSNYGVAAAGGSNSATWTVPVTPTTTGFGTEISATWTASAGNATNATYDVYDGTSSGTLLGTITVDQTKAPDGTADGNNQFQELGVFFPTLDGSGDGTLTVVLSSNSANGNVVADAVGVAPGWASSGGPSLFESEPSYQDTVQSTGERTTPDVSLISSQFSGVTTYFEGALSYDGSGTSLACPCWAGLVAIINQGRVAAGGTTLNSPADPQQTLQALYSLPSSDYHDITSGYNGYNAGSGYDLVTGLGTPITNLLVPAMVAFGLPDVPTQLAFAAQPSGTMAGGTLGHLPAVTPSLIVDILDSHGNPVSGDNSNVTIALTNVNGTLNGTTTVQAVNGVATFTDLSIDNIGSYTVQITDSDDGLAAVTSKPFTITPDTASSQLEVFAPQPPAPSAALVGKALAPTLIVKSVDRFGNLVTTDHSKILLTTNTGSFTGTSGVTLTNGVATFSNIIFKTAGTYTLTATPATNSTLAITSPVSVTANVAKATTNAIHTPVLKAGGYTFSTTPITLSTTLTSNATLASIPFTAGTLVTLHATDTTNTFTANATITASGLAKFSFADPIPGTYTCTLTYPGDTNHTAGTSSNFTLLVKQATTTTTLTTSATSLTSGASLTLTAVVASPGGASSIARTGTVTFKNGATTLMSVPLNGNTATYTFVPDPGVYSITASYSGDPNFVLSTSAAKTVTDNLSPSSIAGQTFFLADTAGTGSQAPGDLHLLTIAGSAHTLTNNDLEFFKQGTKAYSYTYTKTGPTTATLVAKTTSGTAQTITTLLVFTTPTSGTATQTFTGGDTNTVNFVLLGNPLPSNAPANVLGATITLNATAGSGVFASSGSMQLTVNATGNQYTIQGYPGDNPNSSGTYSYNLYNPAIGNFIYSEGEAGTGQIYLAFTSPTAGVYSDLSDFSGWQTGTFTLSEGVA